MTESFNKLISDFAKLKITANSDGLIPTANVLIVQLPSEFYNQFSLKLLDEILESAYKVNNKTVYEDIHGYTECLLENAAAECGYHTGCGIINSDEFAAIMGCKADTPEDILYGLFAITVSWGWGDLEIVELIPNEKLVLRAHDYYEADVRNSLKFNYYFAYMLKGISRAFMDLIYGHKCPPNRLGVFKSEQTKGIELGDSYGEFLITRA